jgi:folylpolyglutamate synthase/dihydropteroate synthase
VAREPGRWVLVSGHPEEAAAAARLTPHRASGGVSWVLDGTWMVRQTARDAVRVMDLAQMPAAWGGLAHHNLENALVAAALAATLGVSDAVISAGLASFGASPDDNPGRAELWRLGPHAVVLDFGHNGHGLEALAPMLRGLRARLGRGHLAPLVTSVGLAGDRERDDAASLLDGVRAIGAEAVWVRGLVGYERGRAPGEMEDLITATFRELGFPDGGLLRASSEPDFLEGALARAGATSTVLALLVHIERDEVRDWLVARGGRPASITSFA